MVAERRCNLNPSCPNAKFGGSGASSLSQTAAGCIGAMTGLIVLGVPGTIIGGLAGNKSTRQRMETRPRQITNCEYQFQRENVNYSYCTSIIN